MRKGKRPKSRSKYRAEYEGDELNLKLEKGVKLRIDLSDNLEVGLFLAKFRQAGLDSSRGLGRVFRRSAATVINKEHCYPRLGSKGLVDKRAQRNRYKVDDLKAEILLIWVKNPVAEDKQIQKELEKGLSKAGLKIDLKTLRRYLREAGIADARSRLRTEGVLRQQERVFNTNEDKADKDAAEDEDQKREEDKQLVPVSSRYAGHMLHVPWLCELGFAQITEVLPSPEDCVYSKEKVTHQLYFLYAVGGKRIYDLDSVDHEGFGALIAEEDNLRCSGMNKRLAKMLDSKVIDMVQEKALAGRAHLITKKDELVYCDSHVIEVYVHRLIAMAMHGTKNKRVKAINSHYLVGSDSGTPIVKDYSPGNKRLHWAIVRLLKKIDQGLKGVGKRIKIICFDKGGIAIKTLKAIAQSGRAFVCWGKRTKYVKKQIGRIKERQFRYKREKEILRDGKRIKVIERIADTTTQLKGWGKIRTIVIQLPAEEDGERLWIYTNLKRNQYGPLEIREMIRYKQRQENFFKKRKYKTALDCFVGGKCKVKAILRPGKKGLELLKKQLRRQGRKIEKDQGNLNEVQELKSHGLLSPEMAKRETEYLRRRIRQTEAQKKITEEKIGWAEGGKRPAFIKQRYELELNKQVLVNEIQDFVILSKRQALKEFGDCYEEVLKKEGLGWEEIEQRMKFLDKVAIEKELFNLGGVIIADKKEKKMTIQIKPQGREYFKKALGLFIHRLNKKGATVDYGSGEKYRLYFCLWPKPG
jgi:hypothetical protein